jgi:plastocyanin
MRRRIMIGAAVAAIASAVAVPLTTASPGAKSSKTTQISVADDYFAPTDLKIKKNDKVKWVWSNENLDTHNVVLTGEHPKKVAKKDFKSSSGAIGIQFKRKFEVPGKYGFICTYHRSVMRFELTVKKH